MSPASYRAAPPRVGDAILCAPIDKDQIHAITRMNLAFIKRRFEVNHSILVMNVHTKSEIKTS